MITPMNDASDGIVRLVSTHSAEQTLARLMDTLEAKKITLFAVVDHSGEAAKAGLTMPWTKLVIFGNPIAGTPLMLAAPGSALDLPLKILIAEEASGAVRVSYNSPAYLLTRHALPETLRGNIAAAEKIAEAICGEG
ncbi:MAG TPA: DUF302 domain-containing protein [Acidobacteriaceae bacterium]|jgi:uncharacterized protein (DUF302 family)